MAIINYTFIVMVVNSSMIRVNASMLSVRVGPLPWFGKIDVVVANIDQLFCEKLVFDGNGRGVSYISYNVIVQQRGGKQVYLVSGLPSYADARYLEQQVEQLFGITDRPMPVSGFHDRSVAHDHSMLCGIAGVPNL